MLNKFAYRTTGLAIKTITNLSKAQISYHGENNILAGSNIFVINHFTRLETFLMPYVIFRLTKIPVWSLASYELFKGAFGVYLEKVGAVSTKNADRDRLIVKTLLTGEANWIIFPEGRMVKNKKIIEKGRFMISAAGGKHPPHTGAATLALRTEFYRQRLKRLQAKNSDEVAHLAERFQIQDLEPVINGNTHIIPVNLTYYPIRARENILSSLAVRLVEDLPERLIEELMTEGSMLLSGVDIDIRFGEPIQILECLQCSPIDMDISAQRRINFDDAIPSRTRMRIEALRLMEKYMAAIYNLTTVNHDHMFASMLRAMRSKKIDEQDLRRRVFLACTRIPQKTDIHLHRSFDDDQMHLLTDDRYHKFQDFLTVALDTGIVSRRGKWLIKDASKFSSAYDFHRARIDNPIDVMANAVEPIKPLQRIVNRIAVQPQFWIRRKVARYLMDENVVEFEKDYATFKIEGETKPMSVGMPFLIKGRSRKLGVMLSHGYMAAPLEVKELAEYLGRLGFWVYVPRLKGHGTSPEDLAMRSYLDWRSSVDRGYAIISNICEHVVAGGFSTGAALALDLADRVDNVIGVFAVAAPMRLRDFSARFAPAVDMWNRLMQKAHQHAAKREFVENKPENAHINYIRNPISGVVEIDRLMDDLEPRLASIMVPTLVVQSSGDPVVEPKGSRKIFELIGSSEKEYVLFNFQRHGILLGNGAQKVHESIGNFIKRL
ncbi:MAG: alpha/beta fold hydrolase [Desulfobacterales bacterium]|jgi:esterase/lipase/1-acyl-sn-glycerol-3-phosphate acyltransferase